jgi:hypothetical protein
MQHGQAHTHGPRPQEGGTVPWFLAPEVFAEAWTPPARSSLVRQQSAAHLRMHSLAHVLSAQMNAVRTPEQGTSIRPARPGHARGCANKVSTGTRTNGGERVRVVDLLRSIAAPADECEDDRPASRHGCLRCGRALNQTANGGDEYAARPDRPATVRFRMPIPSSDGTPGGSAEARHRYFVRLTSPVNLVRKHKEKGAGSPRGAALTSSRDGQKVDTAAGMEAYIRGRPTRS